MAIASTQTNQMPTGPLEAWTEKQVKAWFDLKYSKFSEKFAGLNGEDLASLSEEQCLRRCPQLGDVIFNAIQTIKASQGNFTAFLTHIYPPQLK